MKSKRAFAIPVSLCVAGVVLFLGAGVAQLSAGDLQVATHEYYKERALQIADYALEKGIYDFQTGSATYAFQGVTGANPYDKADLTIYDNSDGELPSNSGCPVIVPSGFQYWVAAGQARNGSRVLATARIGAMVQWGQPLGSAGAQVRFLSVKHHVFNAAAEFLAVDASQTVLDDKIICATEARDATLPPIHAPELVKPLSFHRVQDLHGKVRIPTGAAGDDIVQIDLPPNVHPDIDPTGGFFNIPTYTPPNPSSVESLAVASATPVLLSPGEYENVNLAPGTGFLLKGVYHFKNLNLLAGTGPNPLLQNEQMGATELFIDKVNSAPNVKLKLENPQSSAQAFRINVKPAPPEAPPLEIEVNAARGQATNYGGIWLVAAKRTVNVSAHSGSVIRGSFACNTLGLDFGPGNDPAFVYDTTVDTTRSRDTPLGDPGDPGRPYDYHSGGPQPMILSKNRH